MTDNICPESEKYEEIAFDNKELLNRIRALTRENRELKKQLEDVEVSSSGEKHTNKHCCGQKSSMHSGMCKNRGMGRGHGKGNCSGHRNGNNSIGSGCSVHGKGQISEGCCCRQ